jgi:hypothetical protein
VRDRDDLDLVLELLLNHHVLFVRRRDDDPVEASLGGSLDLVGHAPDRQHVAPDRQRAGHGEVLLDRDVLQRGDDRGGHRHAGGIALDALVGHHVLDVDVLLPDVLVGELLDDRRDVQDRLLGDIL